MFRSFHASEGFNAPSNPVRSSYFLPPVCGWGMLTTSGHFPEVRWLPSGAMVSRRSTDTEPQPLTRRHLPCRPVSDTCPWNDAFHGNLVTPTQGLFFLVCFTFSFYVILSVDFPLLKMLEPECSNTKNMTYELKSTSDLKQLFPRVFISSSSSTLHGYMIIEKRLLWDTFLLDFKNPVSSVDKVRLRRDICCLQDEGRRRWVARTFW